MCLTIKGYLPTSQYHLRVASPLVAVITVTTLEGTFLGGCIFFPPDCGVRSVCLADVWEKAKFPTSFTAHHFEQNDAL